MEPSPEVLNVLSGLGVGGILAALFYYQNNKNALEYTRRNEELVRDFTSKIEGFLNVERGRTEMLVKLVTDNTAQTATNTAVVLALHRRIDKENQDKQDGGHS